MKLDIEVKFNDAYNCIDNLVIEVAKWWGRSYGLFFAESWGFSYNQKDPLKNTIGENVNNGRNYVWENLELYHGIKVNFVQKTDYLDVLNIIKKELEEKRPVMIYMDTFWCPWFVGDYQQINSPHYCLVTGIDDDNNLHIVDNQMATDGAILPEDDFSKGFGVCITFSLTEPPVSLDWKKIIKNTVDRVLNLDNEVCIFDDMKKYGHDISQKLDFDLEVQGNESDPFSAKFFQSILSIGRGRKQFSMALNYLGHFNNDTELISLAKSMNSAGERWMSIFGMTCKSYYLQGAERERILQRVVKKINEAAIAEEGIAKDLIKLYKDENISDINNSIIRDDQLFKRPLRDYQFIAICKYMNNQGFCSSGTLDSKAELSNGGKYFLTDGLPREEEWIVENMKFLFPKIEKDLNDNISCFGQIIEVQSSICNQIMILGCAELGNHSESIEIMYCDGRTEIITIAFTNWGKSSSNLSEVIAWTGKGAFRTENKIEIYPFPVNLFSQIYSLKFSGEIKSIKLPECPNIHIFAITLANSW